MTPSIPPHIIHILLSYIVPPSELEPLPPNIISKPLRQRIHFLALTPEDPAEYLSWPTNPQNRVLDLLEALPKPRDDDQAIYDVRYTVDAENTSAHVCIPSLTGDKDAQAVRLVFLFEDDEWVFHDASTMPFPPSSRASLEDAATAHDPDPIRVPDASLNDFDNEMADEGEDASYWDAYGEGDGDDNEQEPHKEASHLQVASTGTEDAYWAQYSSVHGSGDSTQPSPLPREDRKLHHPPPAALPLLPARTEIPISQFHGTLHHPHQGMPSPMSLTDRLNTISPRPSRPASPLPSASVSGSPLRESWHPPHPHTTQSPLASSTVQSSIGQEISTEFVTAPVSTADGSEGRPDEEEDTKSALQASIRGVYHLWKAGRKSQPATDERDLFLDLVRGAL